MKALFITGSNQSPEINDDWCHTVNLEADKEYTLAELVSLAGCGEAEALWVYVGEDWEDKNVVECRLVNGAVRYKQKFFPWDTNNVTLVREAIECDDEDDDDWNEYCRREIAMEAGMLHGVKAYNDAMAY